MKKKSEKRKQRIKEKTEAAIEAYRTTGAETDPNGMYTGNTVDVSCVGGKIYLRPENAVPMQDADDL